MTIHREENINENKFIQILDSIFKIQLKEKVVFLYTRELENF